MVKLRIFEKNLLVKAFSFQFKIVKIKIDFDILVANPIRLVGILEKNEELRSFDHVTYLVIGII